MHCFNHEKIGVACCKHCNKCLCHTCIVMIKGVVSCAGNCEKEIERSLSFIELSRQSIPKASNTYKNTAIFCLSIGIIFTMIGMLPVIIHRDLSNIFMAVIAIPFFFGAYSNFKSSKKIKENTGP